MDPFFEILDPDPIELFTTNLQGSSGNLLYQGFPRVRPILLTKHPECCWQNWSREPVIK